MTYPDNPPIAGGPDEVVPAGGLSSTGIAALAAKTAQDWEDELYGTADTFLTPISELLGKLYELFAEFVDLDGFIEITNEVLGFFYNLLDRAGFFDLLTGVVDFFAWLGDLAVDSIEELIKPIIELLKFLWNLITGFIDIEPFQDLIEQLVTALSNFLSGQQFVDLFKTLLEFFNGLFGATFSFGGAVEDFVNQLPLIGPIVAAITGKTPVDGETLDLTALSTYFRTLDTRLGDGVNKLVQAAEQLLRGNIPLGLIDNSDENLLSQGDFLTESTVEPASGWSWDSTRSRTGTGGSLKLDCTGSEQRIYCKQDIRVAAGDVLTLTGNVGTDSFTSGSMRLSIVPWAPAGSPAVMTAQTVVNGSARTLAANTWEALPTVTYTVPAGVTAVQVSLVATGNSSAFMYFDDIRLKKKGALAQGAVANLLNAINGILAGAGWAAGQGWQFLEDAIGVVTGDANDALGNTETINTTLFKNPEGGEVIDKDAIPINEVGKAINPTVGSGALMIRASSSPVTVSPGRNLAPDGFFNSLTVSSNNIECLRTNGAAGTGSQSDYAGAFRVTDPGWYLVELAYRLSIDFGDGGVNVTPVLYKGSSLSMNSGNVFKVGTDTTFVWLGSTAVSQRFVQNSFIVYLTANEIVRAGLDVTYFGLNSASVGGSGSSSAECYFSISLLNKNFT